MKYSRIFLGLILAVCAIAILALQRPAKANQYDVALPVVTSTSAGAGINVPSPGSNGLVQTVPGAVTNGALVTTGSGLGVCVTGPIVSSTAGLATSGTLPGTTGTSAAVGQLATNGAGQLIICGTAGSPGTWRLAP